MKAGVIFTGSGPLLVLITYDSFSDPGLIEKLCQKGIRKFIAHEVDVDLCREKYGARFDAIKNDLREKDDMRILDYDGHHVLVTIPLVK